MDKASFSLEHYHFDKVSIDLSNFSEEQLFVRFDPSGVFNKENSSFDLTFKFAAFSNDQGENPFVSIRCIGHFNFENASSINDIPSYFYRNSIAILFPYVRAYISLVTNQANIPPLVLPTMNLVKLESPLKENTIEK